MKLVLAKKPAKDASIWRKAICALIRWRLASQYCHSGVVIDGKLYQSTDTLGLHVTEFDPEGWDLFDCGDRQDGIVLKLFENMQGMKYDWLGILGFQLPRFIQDKSKMYCFEWNYLAMTGSLPKSRVTPEKLLLTRIDMVE